MEQRLKELMEEENTTTIVVKDGEDVLNTFDTNDVCRSDIRELDNRDSNETWIHMNLGSIDPNILEVDFDESIDIMKSFIENGIIVPTEQHPLTDDEIEMNDDVVDMIKKVFNSIHQIIEEYNIQIS